MLGGLFTEDLSWRWVFLINIPVGVATLVYGPDASAPRTRPSPEGRLDVRGLVLSGAGLSLVLYAISEGSVQGWDSVPILATLLGRGSRADRASCASRCASASRCCACGCSPIVCFVRRSSSSALRWARFWAALYLIPVFLQDALHQSPISSGLTTFVEAIGVIVASQTLGPPLSPASAPGCMAGVSTLVLTAVLVWFHDGQRRDQPVVDPARAVRRRHASNSGTFLSVQTSMFTHISRADTSHAAAIYTTQRQASIAIGVAVLTTIVAGVGTPVLTAYHAAFAADAGLSLVAALCAWGLIRTADARATMLPRHG